MNTTTPQKILMHLCSLGILLGATTTSLQASEVKPDHAAELSMVNLPDNTQLSYADFIKKAKVTGLSMAVVEDYQVVFSQTAGLKENGTQHKIDSNTAF